MRDDKSFHVFAEGNLGGDDPMDDESYRVTDPVDVKLWWCSG